jgi:DNA adenine methylase
MLAPWIAAHFPDHQVYVEPFGGGGSVLLRKPRCYAEVYNDLDGEMVNLFRVMRDQGARLRAEIALTLYSRAEFALSYEPAAEPVEQARRTLVRSFQGFSSAAASGEPTGFRANSNRSGSTPATDWQRYPNAMPALMERLRGVVIEQRDALAVCQAHDSADTLHYVDPPYVHDTRSNKRRSTGTGRAYRHEMSAADHQRVAEGLRQLEGTVVVSGYRCDLYDDLYGDWQRVDKAACHAGGQVESLWLSRADAVRDLFVDQMVVR